MSFVCLLFVCLFLPRTTIYVLHSLQHFKHILSIIKQKKVINSVLFSCKHQSYMYLTLRVQATSIHPSHTAEKLRLMGSVNKTLKGSMRTEHLRRTASAISVAVQQHAGMNLSFVFQLSYCLYNLATHRRQLFISLRHKAVKKGDLLNAGDISCNKTGERKEEGEQFSIAQIISITKVRPSRGHVTVTSKTRDCDVAKQNLKKWKETVHSLHQQHHHETRTCRQEENEPNI